MTTQSKDKMMSETHIVDTKKDHLDSFWSIAERYGVSFEELKKINEGKGTGNGNYPNWLL